MEQTVVPKKYLSRRKSDVTLWSLRKTAPYRAPTLLKLLSAMAADPVLCLRQARNSTTDLAGETASLVIWQGITIG